MTFSANTKNELAQSLPESKCCTLAEISGFIRMCGTIRLSGGGRMNVKLVTENPASARMFIKMLQSYFGIHADLTISQTKLLKKGHFYELVITAEMNAEQILRETGILGVKEGCNYIIEGIPNEIIKTKCCRRAYLRGVFLGSGSMSDPEKGYHLEIVCNSEILANDIKRLINGFGLHAKTVLRKRSYVVYIKEGEQIVDFLNILGAHGRLLDFENIRIIKELRNKTNRLVNCETANLDKTVNASGRQFDSIELIQRTRGLGYLPDKLREVAELRLTEREASLKELGEMLVPPVGKSGINHRLKKIEHIAEKLKHEDIANKL
jgi:hypothetical protein